MNQQAVQEFWNAYLKTQPVDTRITYDLPECWSFGHGAQMADKLGGLVVDGVKTATCSLLYEYEVEGEEIPRPGDFSIVLNGHGLPLCLIETIGVQIKHFRDVDAQFAHDEGEGDRSLEYWREEHTHYFTRTYESLGSTFQEDIQVVCERFRLLYLAPAG